MSMIYGKTPPFGDEDSTEKNTVKNTVGTSPYGEAIDAIYYNKGMTGVSDIVYTKDYDTEVTGDIGGMIGSIDYSMKEASGMGAVDYKFNEGNLLAEVKKYVDSTYEQHYGSTGIQSSEVIIDRGRGMGFFLGNVDKYSSRYGNKGDVSDHRKDIMKILHYALLALHTHDSENG